MPNFSSFIVAIFSLLLVSISSFMLGYFICGFVRSYRDMQKKIDELEGRKKP